MKKLLVLWCAMLGVAAGARAQDSGGALALAAAPASLAAAPASDLLKTGGTEDLNDLNIPYPDEVGDSLCQCRCIE